jgi:hypothetical protein
VRFFALRISARLCAFHFTRSWAWWLVEALSEISGVTFSLRNSIIYNSILYCSLREQNRRSMFGDKKSLWHKVLDVTMSSSLLKLTHSSLIGGKALLSAAILASWHEIASRQRKISSDLLRRTVCDKPTAFLAHIRQFEQP